MAIFKTTIEKLEETGFKRTGESPISITFMRLRNIDREVIPIERWSFPIENPYKDSVTIFFRPSGVNEFLISEASRISDSEIKLFLKVIKERRLFS